MTVLALFLRQRPPEAAGSPPHRARIIRPPSPRAQRRARTSHARRQACCVRCRCRRCNRRLLLDLATAPRAGGDALAHARRGIASRLLSDDLDTSGLRTLLLARSCRWCAPPLPAFDGLVPLYVISGCSASSRRHRALLRHHRREHFRRAGGRAHGAIIMCTLLGWRGDGCRARSSTSRAPTRRRS